MGYIPPPHLATPTRPSYAETYAQILATHRRSPLTSASSIIILVAANVDALCAARMFADLFKQDDVMHRIIPVSGEDDLEKKCKELKEYRELHTIIALNIGSYIELLHNDWFGKFSPQVKLHVIDSGRPHSLHNLFTPGEKGDRVMIWDDGGAEDMEDVKIAWEAIQLHPEVQEESDDEDDEELQDENEEDDEDEDGYDDGSGAPSGKRHRSRNDEARSPKRRKVDAPTRMTRDQRDEYNARLEKYWSHGTMHGQSASGTVYILATVLERVDNDLLWLAILGLTFQYNTSQISRAEYDKYHSIYYDEVFRLNPPLPNSTSNAINPDDLSVRATEELRFMLFRHWTLYDAMYHSSYVAGKLGIWKERGRKRLTGLLAKMGFSIPQTQQPYSHMDLDLKSTLRSKLESIAPEYGLLELSYPSFTRCFGYKSPPMSAADAVEALSALLQVAGGVKMEVEIEGARNGGEWFGAGRVWEGGKGREVVRQVTAEDDESQEQDGKDKGEDVQWWQKNFWTAYDALSQVTSLRDALSLAMSLHRAIIRQGTSIIDKQDIKTMRAYRVVILTQGPDLALFTHPGVLSRLAMWLVDALRDRLPGMNVGRRKNRKTLPFVVACLNEHRGTYMVVGVMAALEFGDLRRNEFSAIFWHAKNSIKAHTAYATFDTSVLEIRKDELKPFLEALCEDPIEDAYRY